MNDVAGPAVPSCPSRPILPIQPVNVRDVRMIQGGEHFRFALKTREPIGVSGQRRRKNLEGDLTLQLRVRRPIDLAHAAHAERRDDFIEPELRSDGQHARFVGLYGGTEILERPARLGV